LVEEHDQWQALNTELEYARAQQKHKPQNRFMAWESFDAQLSELCAVFPAEEWSTKFLETLAIWRGDTSEEPEMPINIMQLDEEFLTFYDICVDRFTEVDTELHQLCTKITAFNLTLESLLGGDASP
jgi:hypothetical protein